MEFKSTREAIEFAIRKEEATCQFYHDLAEIMKDPATRLIFEVLGKNELQHRRNLEFELIKQGHTVQKDEFEVSDSDESYLEIDGKSLKMTYVDALQLAIRKEKASFQLFSELMAQTSVPDLKKLFLELAQEEMRHVLQFENEYNNVMPKKT